MTTPGESRLIETELAPLRRAILDHSLYTSLTDERSVRCFMEHHVFAVWDFMCLVKALARHLTCQEVPWLPSAHPEERRFINQVVLDEESDLDALGRPRSHFEMYREAMEAAGADCAPIDRFTDMLRGGGSIEEALAAAGRDPRVSRFVSNTVEIAQSAELDVAAAFAFGRELLIPPMFRLIVGKLAEADARRWSPFVFYLERHVEIDESEHGPIAHAIITRRIEGAPLQRARALEVASRTLRARIALWDATLEAIQR
jgi:hypothetical protein